MENEQNGVGVKVALVVILLVVLGLGVYKLRSNNDEVTPVIKSESESVAVEVKENPVVLETSYFTLVARSFSYSQSIYSSYAGTDLVVKKGQAVSITLNNEEGFHDLVIDEFDMRTPELKAGETATIEFVADRVGTFVYYCSVGNHRAMGMKGNLIVEE